MIYGSKQKFSVGIYGQWGTGKTTLMKMIQKGLNPVVFNWTDEKTFPSLNRFLLNHFSEQNLSWITDHNWKRIDERALMISDNSKSREISILLDANNLTATLTVDGTPVYEFMVDPDQYDILRENRILTIWFDAWRYEREKDFATIALMKTIAYSMGRHRLFGEIKTIILKGLAIITKDVLRKLAVEYVMTQEGVSELESNFTKKMERLADIDRETIYFDGIKTIELKMAEILKKHPQTRVVVFVDDLDRCSAETAMEVFESIKVFLDIEGFVFIIGLSPTIMDKLIRNKFKDLNISWEDYFRKIIQIDVRIPKWQASRINELIDRLIMQLDESSRTRITANNKEENMKLIELAAYGGDEINLNPRYSKQMVNRLILTLSSNPQVESRKILISEVFHNRWREINDQLSDPQFITQFTEFLEMDNTEKHVVIEEARVNAGQPGHKPDPFELFLNEVGSDTAVNYFVTHFSESILEIEKETGEGEGWKKYQRVIDSSVIPFSPAFNKDKIDFYTKLLKYLNKGDQVFQDHIQKRNILVGLLLKNHPELKKLKGFEEIIEKVHKNMSEKELASFEALKQTTRNMYTYNSLISKLVNSNPSFTKDIEEFKELNEHYEAWFKKYEENISKPEVAIVYVGLKENKPFPSHIKDILDQKIHELESQTSYKELQSSPGS